MQHRRLGTVAFVVAAALTAASCGIATDSESSGAPIARMRSSDTSAPGETPSTTAGDRPVAPGEPGTTVPTTAPRRTTGSTAGATRENPGALGQPFTLKDRDDGDLTVTVTGFIPDAWPVIQPVNQFNRPPDAGKTYALVGLSVSYTAGRRSDTVTGLLTVLDLSLFGRSGVEIDGLKNNCFMVVIPNPLDQMSELLSGATVTGNTCFQVPQGDASGPLLLRIEEAFCFANCDTAWVRLQ